MFDKKGAHYGLQVFTRSRNYFTLYKSAGAFDKKGTALARFWPDYCWDLPESAF